MANLEWNEWGREETLKFFSERNNILSSTFESLTNKSYQSISINAILLGLVLNAFLTKVSDISLAIQLFNVFGKVLLFIYFILILLSFIFSVIVISPQNYFVSPINDVNLINKFR
jgi:hypothetical protein